MLGAVTTDRIYSVLYNSRTNDFLANAGGETAVRPKAGDSVDASAPGGTPSKSPMVCVLCWAGCLGAVGDKWSGCSYGPGIHARGIAGQLRTLLP